MRGAGALLAGLLLAFLASEVYVRGLYSLSVTYEPGLGYVNAPGVARWGIEGAATSHWTSHGVRVTPGSDRGAPVLVLGDSFTEALMVEDDEVFPAVAQTTLNAVGAAPPLMLINAGRSTMSVADFVALAPRYRELFHPVWTVFELRASDLADDAWSSGRTRFVDETRAEGQSGLGLHTVVPPPRTGVADRLFQLRQHSMFLGYGAVRVGRFQTAAKEEPPLFQASRRKAAPTKRMSFPIEAELDWLNRAWDGRMTLLFLTSGDSSEDVVEPRLLAWCERNRVSCVSTRTAFSDLRASGLEPCGFFNTPAGEGHLNRRGHAIAGELLGKELDRLRTANAAAFDVGNSLSQQP